MKILAVADLHYHLRKLDWVVHASQFVDLVILAGDHLEVSSHVHRPAQALIIQKYLQRIKRHAKLIVCSGNHDLDSQNAQGEKYAKWVANLRYLSIPADGESVEIDGILFSVFPWADGEGGKQAIVAQLEADSRKNTEKWIWVHHQPPDQSPTAWDGRAYYGAPELRQWIERYQPAIVLSGHVHQSPFVPEGSWADRIGPTWVFNAGHQMGALPPHILFDTTDPMAFWKSMPMAEEIHLESELERPFVPARRAPDWVFSMDQAEAPQLE